MAVISRELGYLFIHTPRTGGTALTKGVLLPKLRGQRLPAERIEIETRGGRKRRVRQHITKAQLIEAGLLSRQEADGLLTFTTVRNPFDVVVSAYVKRRDVIAGKRWVQEDPRTMEQVELAQRLTFPEYVEAVYGPSKAQHLFDTHAEGADVVLRFERLQADFDALLGRLGIGERIEIPRRNVTARDRDHRSYYTPKARMIVERVFADDLERWGYEF